MSDWVPIFDWVHCQKQMKAVDSSKDCTHSWVFKCVVCGKLKDAQGRALNE